MASWIRLKLASPLLTGVLKCGGYERSNSAFPSNLVVVFGTSNHTAKQVGFSFLAVSAHQASVRLDVVYNTVGLLYKAGRIASTRDKGNTKKLEAMSPNGAHCLSRSDLDPV